MQNREHMAGIIVCCFNYLLYISGLDGFTLPSVGVSAAMASGAGMCILQELLAVVMTALPPEPGWETSRMPKPLRGSPTALLLWGASASRPTEDSSSGTVPRCHHTSLELGPGKKPGKMAAPPPRMPRQGWGCTGQDWAPVPHPGLLGWEAGRKSHFF